MEAAAGALMGEALLDRAENVWLPCDLPYQADRQERWVRLSSRREHRHAADRPFQWCMPEADALHVINGMGVALGDSIVGMGVLAWLKASHPSLQIHLYRSRHTTAYVKRLYRLAGSIVEPVRYLPRPLNTIPADAIDLSDFLHWPAFASEPMVDFFARGLGIAPEAIPASAKANRWLAHLPLPQLPKPWAERDYVLYCGQASTPLRSIPADAGFAIVDQLWKRYRRPVLGFGPVAHPGYHDISLQSRSLDHFMAWIKHAKMLFSTDSSAIHIAAGFDVPTLAVFTSILPALRVRDYPHCRAMDVRIAQADGLHESDDPLVLGAVRRMWSELLECGGWPWPDLPALRPTAEVSGLPTCPR